jgi:hypothetical protein
MYGSSKEVYITPAPMAFWVWSLIHLLLLGTMFFQFTERGKEIIVDSIGWRFALLGVFNTVYIFFWSRHWYILAFVLSLYVHFLLCFKRCLWKDWSRQQSARFTISSRRTTLLGIHSVKRPLSTSHSPYGTDVRSPNCFEIL